MNKYTVDVTQELKYKICVWADSEAEAIELAEHDKRLEEYQCDWAEIKESEVVCIWGSL